VVAHKFDCAQDKIWRFKSCEPLLTVNQKTWMANINSMLIMRQETGWHQSSEVNFTSIWFRCTSVVRLLYKIVLGGTEVLCCFNREVQLSQ